MRRRCGLAIVVLAIALPATAQTVTSTTGAVNGIVYDSTHAVAITGPRILRLGARLEW